MPSPRRFLSASYCPRSAAAMALHHLFEVIEGDAIGQRQGMPEALSRDSDQDVKVTAGDGHGFQPGALICEAPDLSFGVGDLVPAGREGHGRDPSPPAACSRLTRSRSPWTAFFASRPDGYPRAAPICAQVRPLSCAAVTSP